MTSSFTTHVLEQLDELPVQAKAMFGGHGLYLDESFFGIVYDGRLYLKTNGDTRRWYESFSMASFRPTERQHLKNYVEVPADALEDRDLLKTKALAAAKLR